MKWPRSLPDIRDEMNKLSGEIKAGDKGGSTAAERLAVLAGCLTEAIVDAMRGKT